MNDCHSLWGKLLSSMIRLHMNVTNVNTEVKTVISKINWFLLTDLKRNIISEVNLLSVLNQCDADCHYANLYIHFFEKQRRDFFFKDQSA